MLPKRKLEDRDSTVDILFCQSFDEYSEHTMQSIERAYHNQSRKLAAT